MLPTKLKMNRELFNLTQKQMADVLNIDRSTYAYYETGKSLPTLDTIVKIARIFNVSIDELLEHQTVGTIDLVSDNTISYKRRLENSRVSALSMAEQDLLLRIRQMPLSVQKEIMAKFCETIEKYKSSAAL